VVAPAQSQKQTFPEVKDQPRGIYRFFFISSSVSLQTAHKQLHEATQQKALRAALSLARRTKTQKPNETAQATRYFHSGIMFFFLTMRTLNGCPRCLKM